MKVVFDTNVFVSALTLPGGRGHQTLDKIIEGEELARVAVFLSTLADHRDR